MERLALLRHGIALPHGTPGVREEDRPLTPEGEKKVLQVVEGLRRLRMRPDAIVTSPLPRARKTAELAASVLGLSQALRIDEILLPESPATAIRAWLGNHGEKELMLVGHNPNLSDLLAILCGLPEGTPGLELKKGGVAYFQGEKVSEFRLSWLATPKLIRRLVSSGADRED